MPPGVALCGCSATKLTQQERMVTQSMMAPCIDGEGYITPAQIFPWFSRGIQYCFDMSYGDFEMRRRVIILATGIYSC